MSREADRAVAALGALGGAAMAVGAFALGWPFMLIVFGGVVLGVALSRR